MAKRYFRSNYSEINTQFEPPFDNAVCIPLTKGRHAIIDAEDYDLVQNHIWYYGGYAATNKGEYPNNKPLRMHTAVKGGVLHVDHINLNKLDNRKSNLRKCTSSQNNINKTIYQNSTGRKYKGTSRRGNAWRARSGGRNPAWLGTFATEEEAALAYNEAIISQYGEFARLNIIEVKK